MIYLWASLLVLLNLVWLLLVVFGLPGTWLMVATAGAVAWWQWEAEMPMFAIGTLIAAAALAAVGEALEFFAGVAGAAKSGSSKRGSVGALIGAIVGGIVLTPLIPIPIVGSILGACAGAAIGALIGELTGGRTIGESFKSGAGAGAGTFVGRIVKIAAGVAIWIVLAIAAFWP